MTTFAPNTGVGARDARKASQAESRGRAPSCTEGGREAGLEGRGWRWREDPCEAAEEALVVHEGGDADGGEARFGYRIAGGRLRVHARRVARLAR